MIQDLFSVEGKRVVVTGGTRGIGYMIAEGFVRAGARVIVASRNAEACARAEAALSQLGDTRAVPALTRLKSERNKDLVKAAEAALTSIGGRKDGKSLDSGS